MINEKFRERSAVFDFLATDAARASAFIERVCDAAFVERQKAPGRLMVVRFLVGAFQNLATEFVRVPLLKLVHLPLWDSVSPTLLQIEVCACGVILACCFDSRLPSPVERSAKADCEAVARVQQPKGQGQDV